MTSHPPFVRWLDEVDAGDVASVGGKNASLGEMISKLQGGGVGLRIPDGFAVTAAAYRHYLATNRLADGMAAELSALRAGEKSLSRVGKAIRGLLHGGELSAELRGAIDEAYATLATRHGRSSVDVAVRSSATAEDLPQASFAGQQETYLNVDNVERLLECCRLCYASLFTDRAISYREQHGFDHMQVALAIGVQKMVRSDSGGSGVMFTIDTDTGFPGVVVINAAWGLGENVVQGTVDPDEYRVFKSFVERGDLRPVLGKTLGSKRLKMIYDEGGGRLTRNVATTRSERSAHVLDDEQILQLARWGTRIEHHYGRPMDIEWALDGETGEMFIVQARPETIESRREAGSLQTYELQETGPVLLAGLAIGGGISSGPARILPQLAEIDDFPPHAVLVTERTDPDWVPIMKHAAGIVTEHGGRTSHAAIVSRELGVPAVIGAAGATTRLQDEQLVTLDCSGGQEGYVYEGLLAFERRDIDLGDLPATSTSIMMNIASPDAAMRWWRLPCDGIGLARIEFIISNVIRAHPLALLRFDELDDARARRDIERLTMGYRDKGEFFVDTLSRGIATIAASRYPDPVIVRLSDFKSNEYAALIGGAGFEPQEENPMLGLRGAARYYSERFAEAFELECRALLQAREHIGFDNIIAMVPFCRTVAEADKVLEAMGRNGLVRGQNGLRVYMMCEIPSNVVLAEQFASRFDGFSVGSNDLTQLVLGVDRDSEELAGLFDERDAAVCSMVRTLIARSHEVGCPVSICGQAPSDYPEFTRMLIDEGIDSISLNPDRIIETRILVAEQEAARDRQRQGLDGALRGH